MCMWHFDGARINFDRITAFFFLGGGGAGVSRGTWSFTLREHWKITHSFEGTNV